MQKLSHSSWRNYIIVGLLLVYSLVHILIAPKLDTFTASFLALLPVIGCGWLLGLLSGFWLSMVVALPLNTILVNLTSNDGLMAVLNEPQDIAGTLSLILLGTFAGYVGDLQRLVQRELTERKQTEASLAQAHEELQEKTTQLQQANQDLEMLLYVVSHDLKEPLRSMQNFSRLVSRRYGDVIDEKGLDYLQRIDRAGARLYQLIDDILLLSRAKRIEQPATEIVGSAIIERALEGLAGRILETGATIEVQPNLPPLRVDVTWATQAVYNLVSNALKYSDNGSPPEIEIAPYDGPEGCGFIVMDRGPGVPEGMQEQVFQLFQRGVGREIEGTGAGLAIVRQIAERHGGSAWMSARPGGGSMFYIVFGKTYAMPAGVHEILVAEGDHGR